MIINLAIPVEDNAAAASEADTDEKPTRRRPRISKDAPRERRELDPGDNCPECGGDLRVLGEDVSELIDMMAAQLKVIEIARIKKSCSRCEKIVQEPAPSRPIPRSMAGPGLLAYILTSKFGSLSHMQACVAGQWITSLFIASTGIVKLSDSMLAKAGTPHFRPLSVPA